MRSGRREGGEGGARTIYHLHEEVEAVRKARHQQNIADDEANKQPLVHAQGVTCHM